MTQKQKELTPHDKFVAAIGYLGVLCIIPLFVAKKDPFVQHHGKQGLVLLIAWIILWAGNIIPILGQIVWVLGSLALLILAILGMVNAFQGKKWDMPFLGGYAKGFTF